MLFYFAVFVWMYVWVSLYNGAKHVPFFVWLSAVDYEPTVHEKCE